MAPLAPRRPAVSWLVQSNATKSAVLPHPPSLSPHLQAQNIASPKWLPTTYAPRLSKTAACATYCMDRFNYKYGRPFYFLLASSLLQHANRPHNFLTQPSQLSEPTQGSSSTCTPLFPFPARFSVLHCRSPSLSFVLTSTSGLSSA